MNFYALFFTILTDKRDKAPDRSEALNNHQTITQPGYSSEPRFMLPRFTPLSIRSALLG